MNKSYEFDNPVIHGLDDQDTPSNLALIPKIFRLTNIERELVDDRRTRCIATLYHDSASLRVNWTVGGDDHGQN